MHTRHMVLIAAGALAAAGVSVPGPWRAALVRATPAPQGNAPVKTVPAGQRFAARPGERGATYYALEAQTVRLTTKFTDAIAVGERSFDGHLHTKLTDAAGNELGRFKVQHVDGASDVLQYVPQAGAPLQAIGDPGVRTTIDWANRQVYALWKDRADGGAALEWQGGLMRSKAGPRRDPAHDIVELETEWAGGLAAKTVRKAVVRHQPVSGRTVTGDVLVTRLTKDGADAGTVNWYPGSQILMWDLPGVTKRGYIAPEHLKDYGGWPFTPDETWLNLQTIAFHHYSSVIAKNGYVARAGSSTSSPLGRLVQFFAPTLLANDDGCDGLHWLDGTVLRYCCDVHDFCYEKYGCSARSWWLVWSKWTCDLCNAWVISCFLDGGEPPQWGMVK